MTALAKSQRLVLKGGGMPAEPQVAAGVKIYKGAVVGINPANGYARPFATGDNFAGHALAEADNTNGAAGAIRVPLHRGDYLAEVPTFSSSTVAHIGKEVWTSSDNHTDLSRTDPGTTKTTTDLVGYIADVTTTGVVVRFVSRKV